jgi:hypothetical protein
VRKEPSECPGLAVTALWETGTPGSRAMLPLGVDEATALVIKDTQQSRASAPDVCFRPHPKKIELTFDMAQDFKPYKVAVVSIWPGPTATERSKSILAKMPGGNKILESAETPKFSGLAIASLYSDPQLMSKSGSVVIAAEAALEYGFKDFNGKQPPICLDKLYFLFLILCLFVPTRKWSTFGKFFRKNGGDDETRTRDLCRDSAASRGNCL